MLKRDTSLNALLNLGNGPRDSFFINVIYFHTSEHQLPTIKQIIWPAKNSGVYCEQDKTSYAGDTVWSADGQMD